MKAQLEEATKILKDGGIVIFPTDTAYGIGCKIDDEKAIKRLFEIRRRPITQATPVLVDSIEMAQNYLEPISKEVERLIKTFWPGALTIILRCIRAKVPDLVRGGGGTIGVRMPNNEVARVLIWGVGTPLLGPSANFHGEKTPYSFSDLNPKLISLVDYVLHGETNNLGKASTVIDCSVKPWRVVREGAVKLKLHDLSSST